MVSSVHGMQVREKVSHEFDALGDDYFADPARHFERVRDEFPVFWYPYLNSWVVTRKSDIELILSDWKRFRNGVKGESIHVPEPFTGVVPRDLFANILIGSDPPRHTRNRAIAQRGFVKPRMDALEPVIEQRAHAIIDALETRGSCNLLADYCLELTTQTFMALFGLPQADESMMRQLRDDMFMILGSALEPMSEPTLTEVWTRYTEALSHIAAVARERAEDPKADLISEMASARDSDGQPAMRPEQVALHIAEFAGAATDTTAQAMANAVLFLGNSPESLSRAQADPSLWGQVFDETLRRRPSGTSTRWATEDVELGGVTIKAGDAVWLGLASANTDPDYYENPFEFSLDREMGDHLAFTRGRHTCLGQPLARVQGSTGLRVLFERLPSLRPEPDAPLDFLQLALLPIRRSLPVQWNATQDAGKHAPADVSEVIGAPVASAHIEETIDVRVAKRTMETDRVMALEFEHPSDEDLPAWNPGAHIDVLVGDGSARQFSLCSDPADRRRYRVGILHDPEGTGGSVYLHDKVNIGDILSISEPRNHFDLGTATKYHFVAGGIGITPLLPMIRAAEDAGADWDLVYCARSRDAMAFTEELTAYGDKVTLWASQEKGRLALDQWLGASSEETSVYACGPVEMLNALEDYMASWPADALHVEYFEPKMALTTTDDEAFEVEFVESGITTTIAADETILESAEKLGINVFSSCQEGTCGTCETPIMEGRADHRDSLLTPDEMAENDTMMICVSRAEKGCPKLRLEL